MKKLLAIILSFIVALWAAVGIIDYFTVHAFKKPVFCIPTDTADDGGSGHYAGLGYSFDINGNFLPEDEYPGVTGYTYYLFGTEIGTGIRD